jgi:hypothetical protein
MAALAQSGTSTVNVRPMQCKLTNDKYRVSQNFRIVIKHAQVHTNR